MGSPGRGSPLAAHPSDQHDFIYPIDFEERMARMNFHDAGPRPSSVHSASSISVGGKNFIYLSFKRQGEDWYSATTSEIPAPQADLEKLLKKNKGKALQTLDSMAETRRKQIQQMASELSAQEVGGVYWEPAYIKSTDESLSQNGKLRVKAFKVIFARQSPRKVESSPPRRPLGPRKVSIKQAAPPTADKSKAEEKPKTKPKPARRVSELNDPFSTTRLFGDQGHPMDAKGYVPFANAGLPANIGPDRPIGQKPVVPEAKPKEEKKEKAGKNEKGKAEQPKFPGIIDLNDILHTGGAEAEVVDDSDEVLDVEEIVRNLREQAASRPHASSKSRRRSSALREGVRYRHAGSKYAEYPSSRSSWASDNSSAIVGEWDDISSKTSDETQHSYIRSPGRKTYRIPAGRQYSRESRYRRDDRAERIDRGAKILVADGRKHPPPAIEPRHEPAAIDQSQPKAHSSPKPMVHQLVPPQSSRPVPPPVEWPDVYQREQENVRFADDYMRNKIREDDHRKHEQAASQQHRDPYATQTYGAGYGGAKRRYTFDPRQPAYFAR